jgi:hypothetical protein
MATLRDLSLAFGFLVIINESLKYNHVHTYQAIQSGIFLGKN